MFKSRSWLTHSRINTLTFLIAVFVATPGIAFLAWLAIWAVDLPPHGPAGRWVALLLAAVFFGASACGLYLIGMSLAMSGVEGAEAPAHPILYICKTIYGVAAIFTVVNLPFTLCLLIALGIKKPLG
jgi:hypothetical protein